MLRTMDEEACHTVSAISGNLARLAFLASMQQQPGEYRHWGLAREYGQQSVSQAFWRSHQIVLETLLQTDISELLGELLTSAQARRECAIQSLERWLKHRFLQPVGSAKHTNIHFKLLCESLRALARHHE